MTEDKTLKQRVDDLIQFHSKPKVPYFEIIISICGYCQIEYNYRLYNEKGLIKESKEPFNTDYKEVLSHGICPKCLKDVYKEYNI